MEAIIETKQLSHIYSAGTPFERGALLDVDFTAYRGEYLGIIGHTGSGKSTLIQHLNALLKPTSGQVLFEGRDIWSDPKTTRASRFQVHFSRIEFTKGGEKRHWTFAETQFGPEPLPLLELLVERRLEPVIICESAGTQAEDAAVLADCYRNG